MQPSLRPGWGWRTRRAAFEAWLLATGSRTGWVSWGTELRLEECAGWLGMLELFLQKLFLPLSRILLRPLTKGNLSNTGLRDQHRSPAPGDPSCGGTPADHQKDELGGSSPPPAQGRPPLASFISFFSILLFSLMGACSSLQKALKPAYVQQHEKANRRQNTSMTSGGGGICLPGLARVIGPCTLPCWRPLCHNPPLFKLGWIINRGGGSFRRGAGPVLSKGAKTLQNFCPGRLGGLLRAAGLRPFPLIISPEQQPFQPEAAEQQRIQQHLEDEPFAVWHQLPSNTVLC